MADHFPNTPDPGPRLLYQDSQGNLSPTPPSDSNAALATQLRGNLSGALRGDLPPDVVQQIQQNAAEFGVSSGLSGSQFAGYQGLKNLGLTSLNRAQQAEQELVNPLLGYHPLQILPGTPPPYPQPQSNINWAQSTSPAGVTGIAGGGAQRTMPAPLADPRSGWGQQGTNVQDILGQLASKYGNLGSQGGVGFASPMGQTTLPAYSYPGLAPGAAQGYGQTTTASPYGGYDPMMSDAQAAAWVSGNPVEGVQPTSGGYMYMAPPVPAYADIGTGEYGGGTPIALGSSGDFAGET